MKKMRLLAVSFDTDIKPWEIHRFRGAVARKVGLEHEWFHNHDNSPESSVHSPQPEEQPDNSLESSVHRPQTGEQSDNSPESSVRSPQMGEQSDNGQLQDETNSADAKLPAEDYGLKTKKYHHRYPLIQYKIDTHGRQMRPMLLCLDDCIEEAHHFFSQPDWSLRIGNELHEMRIARLHVDQINLNVWEQPLHYRMHKWRALNSENFREWQQLEGIVERTAFLENILAAHILSFARGVGWELDKRFEVKITKLLKEEWVSFKKIKMLAFTIEFKANLSIPDYIGLGQGAGEGFGVVRRQQTRRHSQNKNGRSENENLI